MSAAPPVPAPVPPLDVGGWAEASGGVAAAGGVDDAAVDVSAGGCTSAPLDGAPHRTNAAPPPTANAASVTSTRAQRAGLQPDGESSSIVESYGATAGGASSIGVGAAGRTRGGRTMIGGAAARTWLGRPRIVGPIDERPGDVDRRRRHHVDHRMRVADRCRRLEGRDRVGGGLGVDLEWRRGLGVGVGLVLIGRVGRDDVAVIDKRRE